MSHVRHDFVLSFNSSFIKPQLECSLGNYILRKILTTCKVQRAAAMIRCLERISCGERLKQVYLFNLEKGRLKGDMPPVFRYVENYWKEEAKESFMTTGHRIKCNGFKLQPGSTG